MLTLHDYLPSQNGWKVRTLLNLLGLEYHLREVDIFAGESRTEAYFRLNPVGAVPALELGDGRAIAESNAILAYLADATPFLPDDRFHRAKVLQWMFFEQYYVEPTIGSLRFWTLTGRLGVNAALVDGKRQTAERALKAMERELGASTFFCGEIFSIADIALYAYAHLAHEADFSLAPHPAVRAWIARVAKVIGPDCPVHYYGDEARLAS